MHSDIPEAKARRYRRRKTTSDRVREQVLILAGRHAQLLTHEERPWASVTFSGSRHELMIDFDGEKAVADAEMFMAFLPEHEFTIPRMLVADATISAVDQTVIPEPRIVITATLLLLEET